MRFIKWGIVFAIAFLSAWIIIFTFSQEPFKIEVPAKVLVWQTPSIPVYIYLTGAFTIGLFIGLCVAIYDKFVLQSKLSKKTKAFRSIESEMTNVKMDLEQCQQALFNAREALQAEKNNNPGDVNGIEGSHK